MPDITSVINQLNAATPIVVLSEILISCVPGTIGLILNILVFTRPTLRLEPCSVYFLSSAIFNLFVVFIVMPVRTTATSANLDMANYNLGLCKIEFFAFFTVRVMAFWSIVLACVDRYLHSSTSIRLRRLSSLKVARLAVCITTTLMFVLYSHMILFYEIGDITNQYGQMTPKCQGRAGLYRTFIAFWHMSFFSLLPALLMVLFGCLTLNNIRQQRRLVAMTGENSRINRPTDRQLLRMLTAQVFIIIMTTLPYAVNRLYLAFTASVPKSNLQIARENLATQTLDALAYFGHSSGFFSYTLTGAVFRKELSNILIHYRFWRHNAEHIRRGTNNQTSNLSAVTRRKN